MTNVILNNQYNLHEPPKPPKKKQDKKNKEQEEENNHKINHQETTLTNSEIPDEQRYSKPLGKNKKQQKTHIAQKTKTKKKKKRKLLKIVILFFILLLVFLFLFFKTPLFQKWKELWVQTAMTTMNHQYLAKWFLSDEEIEEIMKKLAVENNENSDSNGIQIRNNKNNIKVEKITGKGYVGYVMIVPNASKVKLVDGRKSGRGSKLSEIVKENKAVGGTNAGGFADPNGVGAGNVLCDAVIMDKKMIYGNKNTRYSLIGLDASSKLVLGKYNYQEAIKAGITSAVEFGPFIIVNGKDQIKNANSGGIQPRMAIGQKKDGTFIFVAIDGRQPGYSLGTNLLELQNIFKKYGAYNAANLDGGSSATMYYDGKVVNKTSTPMGERYLPNAFIIEK